MIQIFGQKKGLFYKKITTRYLSEKVPPLANPFSSPLLEGEKRFNIFIKPDDNLKLDF